MDRKNELVIKESLKKSFLKGIPKKSEIEYLVIKTSNLKEVLTAELAKEILELESLHTIELWCSVEREAINHIIKLPKLKIFVSIFGMKEPKLGKLQGFSNATTLEKFHSDYEFDEDDFLEVVKAPNLRSLRAHSSHPTPKAIEAILTIPYLTSLDLEDSQFDDEMAKLLATSKTITELEVGGSEITAKGLGYISTIKQLRKLDIWSTDIEMNDLDILKNLQNLEYLSIGSASNPLKFSGKVFMEKLYAIPVLKHLWLDGVTLSKEQVEELSGRYEEVACSPTIESPSLDEE